MPFKANQEYFPPLPRGLASTGWCDQLCYLFFYLPLKTSVHAPVMLIAGRVEHGAPSSLAGRRGIRLLALFHYSVP